MKTYSGMIALILSRRRPLSYRTLPIDLRSKSMDSFLYDNGLRLERVNNNTREHWGKKGLIDRIINGLLQLTLSISIPNEEKKMK